MPQRMARHRRCWCPLALSDRRPSGLDRWRHDGRPFAGEPSRARTSGRSGKRPTRAIPDPPTLINSDVYLAPNASFGTAMLAGVPFSFAFGLDACTIDQQVQRARAAAIRQADIQGSIGLAWSHWGHGPISLWRRHGVLKSATAPSSPTNRSRLCRNPVVCRVVIVARTNGAIHGDHAERNLQRQTGLDRSIAETLLPTTRAARRWHPDHLGITPDPQRSTTLQRVRYATRTSGVDSSLSADQFVVLYFVGVLLLTHSGYHPGFAR